jgi:hypothetical protein
MTSSLGSKYRTPEGQQIPLPISKPVTPPLTTTTTTLQAPVCSRSTPGVTATSKHTTSNGCCTVVIRGRIQNKIMGSIGYGPSIMEDTPSNIQYWYVLLDSDCWQDKHGLCTSWLSKHWILQQAPVLDLTGYYKLSHHQGGDIEQGWGQRK